LHKALKRHFGYDTFRPHQEEIIQDALAGRDVFALLPTGGGKSLCFQLPAVMRPGLTVVVSPLVALMKDQVDGLSDAGVAATFLNSTLKKTESTARLRGLYQGAYRLLYVAPERLTLSGFLSELPKWNVNLFAVDEAHCISEWGHDFRPEYRDLQRLRELLPATPIMALTATATTRVRLDIVEQLRLREPCRHVGSFNRPNLFYRVRPKQEAFEQVLAYVGKRRQESGIIYCQARKTVEKLAERLSSHGIRALPYHAGLTPAERTENQERFIRDQVQVICATIAFGMGINKPNVRFVIHYDLPKNVEGYYQETGRAGRDGLPSECLLLFSTGDAIKQQVFIDEKTNPQEQEIARQQLRQMLQYAEQPGCRRDSLLAYFGETYPKSNCGGCDNCLEPHETFDGTIAAQKLLSCVYRIREKGRFSVGLNHVVAVLCGARTERVQQWGHDTLSTYGIGTEFSRNDWLAIGRELVRHGLLAQSNGQFPTVEISPEGRAFLKHRPPLTLTKPKTKPVVVAVPRDGEIPCDEFLFQRLRDLRRRLADERDVPAYVIFSDVALRHMAREYPQSREELLGISGVGEAKLRAYGEIVLAEIQRHLAAHPRQTFPPLR
jgi:ATP-dependent DNA helicase RecQ